jgi:diguanylate cyclase (GGDEF)-like protein/PAS domain S-box-containing protein
MGAGRDEGSVAPRADGTRGRPTPEPGSSGAPSDGTTAPGEQDLRRVPRDALEVAERKWRILLESTSDTVTVVDAEGRVMLTTGEFDDVLGYATEWWQGEDGFSLLHPDDLPRARATFAQVLLHPGRVFREDLRTRHHDGHYELIEYTAVNRLAEPAVGGIVITTRNITEERRTEALVGAEAEILELIARGAPLTETLSAIAKMVEYHALGRAVIRLLPEAGPPEARVIGDPSLLDAEIDRTLSQPILDPDGSVTLGTITVRPDRSRQPDDRQRAVVATATHLATIALERDRIQRDLEYRAHHDPLTGLPNRAAVLDALDGALARREGGAHVAVMLIDLDRFKVVNDSLGHATGDAVLVAFGHRIRSLVHGRQLVGHLGGDEFIVVLDRVPDLDEARRVASRLDLALTEPFTVEDPLDGTEHEIFVSCSIGVAITAGPGDTSHDLLQHADAALHRAKERGRDRMEVFDEGMRRRVVEQLRTDQELRLAVERAELQLHYQPTVDVATGRIVGVEALLRWPHPERGLVLPAEFIGVAEETGLIVRIGRWVIEEAVRQVRAWADRIPGSSGLAVAVNVSARQLTAPGLAPTVARVLERHDWPAEQLTLELTESILVDDAEAALTVLGQLKALGVRLAIDDFGTGYSSLSYLHRFPVDVVKIDRTFIHPLGADGEGSPVATAVVSMARALGLATVAEGVEGTHQLEGLRTMGCDGAQGFLFTPALPADEIAELLARGTCAPRSEEPQGRDGGPPARR